MATKKSDDRTMAILAHVLGLLVGFLGPLIILLAVESEYVKNHARIALNWQFSVLIYLIICLPLMIILIGIPLIFAVSLVDFIFPIIAAVKASNDELWKYPVSIPFFKVK
ncbi:MAG: DUF4870 domain-containing protein [bacterium]|nr:DUF4870 domain-containing protein [bacterium]